MARKFIEGLPCAGKSTLIKRLETDNEHIVHELGRVIPANEFPGNGSSCQEIKQIDSWFIDKEAQRIHDNQDGYFDRSYLTHLAYAYAYSRLTGLNSFEQTIGDYQNATTEEKIVPPDEIIYIKESPEESIKRQLRRIQLGHRALDKFWRDEYFLKDTVLAYEAIMECTENVSITILDSLDPVGIHANMLETVNNKSKSSPNIDLDAYISLMRG